MIFTPNNIMAASRFLVDPKANKVMSEMKVDRQRRCKSSKLHYDI